MTSAPVESAPRHKFLTLDGLRGLAAMAVLLWHGRSFLDVVFPDSAYLAVDLFFLMSGFVVAYSYEEKLRAGMSFAQFLGVRMRRLYPLYLLGTLVMAAFFLVSAGIEGYAGDRPPVLRSLAFGLFMLPTPSADLQYYLYPLSPAAWSLFFEVAVNLAYAALLRWLSSRVLAGVAAISAAALALIAMGAPDLDLGWNWASLAQGIARVSFSFSLGVLIFRFRSRLPAVKAPAPVLLLAVLLMLCLPRGEAWTSTASVAVILAGFPAVMIAAIGSEPVRFRAAYALLGYVSYPLYILHHGLLRWLNGVAAAVGWDLEAMPAASYALLGVIAVLCWAAARLFDEPVRRRLAGRIRRPRAGAPQPEA